MDTHIVGDPAQDSAPPLRARLPGEPEPGFDVEISDEALRAGLRAVPPTTSAPKSARRSVLLAGVAAVTITAIAGVGFLVSPYNKIVSMPPALSLAVLQAETHVAFLWHYAMSSTPQRAAGSAEATAAAAPAPTPHAAIPTPSSPAAAQPLAPSAALAGIHPLGPPPAVVEPAYKRQPQDLQLAEVLKLGQAAAVPSSKPAKPSAAALADAGSHVAPAVQPGPPLGYVPHEPGAASAAAAPPAGSVLPVNTETTGRPAAQQPEIHPSVLPIAQTGDKGTDGREPGPTAHVVAAEPGQGKPGARPAGEGGDTGMAKPQVVPAANGKATPIEGKSDEVHVASSTPADALSAARDLRAAPMSSAQQVQVLELVTQLATLIRDERTEIGNLQADVRKSAGATSAKLGDFERRLALVEAGTAMAAASGPATAPPSAGSADGPRPSAIPVALTSAKVALAAAARAPTSAPTLQASSLSPKKFRVQAASPGLAMLAEVDRGGGDGAQVAVQVGDAIPGYGRVLSVGQRGTSWVVLTEHGTIQ